jgi:deoxyribodipyrimidine photolyase-related protein
LNTKASLKTSKIAIDKIAKNSMNTSARGEISMKKDGKNDSKSVLKKTGTLRLILGDQLNPLHSWFTAVDDNVIYTLMELRQETDYVLHHAQKILAIFAGMRDFAAQLEVAGHRVHYVEIDDAANLPTMTDNLNQLIAKYQATAFEYQAPDEWRLDMQLADFAKELKIDSQVVDSEHFFTTREEAPLLFGDRKKWLMETFYRQMRVKHSVLIEAGSKPPKPVGDQWNFDAENRKAWPGLPAAPADIRVLNRKTYDYSALWATIVKAGVKSFGEPNAAKFGWPLNRAEALAQLDTFIDQVLPNFGDFEDAMSSESWRLFHSLLSFSMNVKMLNPREVVAKAEAAGRSGAAPLAAVEGFIRQILGWREFMRGFYWAKMKDAAGSNPKSSESSYADNNYFDHQLPLPTWFWTGQTQMRCMAAAIGQSLEQAYAHHIQRLMLIGNFALLAGLNPKALHHWYLGIYIDAFEWVELPNTVGMSQFADGGLLATKPYTSSAAYIDRMSDYCKGCHYDKKLREDTPTKQACPFNALYWDFHVKHADKLAKNPRIGMVYQQLKKMDAGKIEALQVQAKSLRTRLDTL